MPDDTYEICLLLDEACHLMMHDDDSLPGMSQLGVVTCWMLAASLAAGRPVAALRFPGTAARCFTWAAFRVTRWDPRRLTDDELFFAMMVRDVDLDIARRQPSRVEEPLVIGAPNLDLAWG